MNFTPYDEFRVTFNNLFNIYCYSFLILLPLSIFFLFYIQFRVMHLYIFSYASKLIKFIENILLAHSIESNRNSSSNLLLNKEKVVVDNIRSLTIISNIGIRPYHIKYKPSDSYSLNVKIHTNKCAFRVLK